MKNLDRTKKVVEGKITDAEGRRLSNVLVRAFDRDMRNKTLLGESLTDSKGEYWIEYSDEQIKHAEKLTADLSLKVLSAGGKIVYYEGGLDEVLFNASEKETIDIRIKGERPAEENEFDLLRRQIPPLTEKIAVTDLEENNKNRDITFLARETGIVREKIGHFAIAHRLAESSKAEPAFFYALLRKNTLLTNDLSRGLRARLFIDVNTAVEPLLFDAALLDPKTVERDVEAAAKENLIPAEAARNWKRNFELLRKFKSRAEEYYQSEYPRKVMTLLDNFAMTDKIAEIRRIAAENKSDLAGFLDKISSEAFLTKKPKTGDAKVSAALTNLLGFDAEIVAEVKKAQKINKPQDIRKLAAMNKADWTKALAGATRKASAAGVSADPEVLEFHALSLARKMEAEFPSVAFSAQLAREKKNFLGAQDEIKEIFAKHEDFDLLKTNVDRFLAEKKIAGAENEALRNELKAVQRIFRLVPRYSKTRALLRKNLHSAQAITAMGKTRFLKEVAPDAGIEKKEALEIFQKAERTSTAAMLVAGELQDTLSAMDISALNVAPLAKKLAAVSAEFPNLKTLFRLSDTCSCEHCRSVYSPAAYLVELLEFLDDRRVIDLATALPSIAKDVLFERRPDLGEIDLSCENANTPLPYIDLVCELLEEIVAPDPGVDFTGVLSDGADPLKGKISAGLLSALSGAGIPVSSAALVFETEVTTGSPATLPHYVRDKEAVCKVTHVAGNTYKAYRLRQTLASAEELAAAPAYVNSAAYTALRTASYAFKLPFDLAQTEARAYFSRFGIERGELMEDFQSAGAPADRAIAAERLGLTDAERHLIVTPDPLNQKKYWNTLPVDASSELKVVSRFLDKTGLSYEDLDVLLKLKFIDPADDLFIKHLDLSCDTDQKEIANLDDPALDRIHRFLRLRKKTGWSIETLDEVISQTRLGNGKLDAGDDDGDGLSNGDELLIRSAVLLRIARQTGLKIDELIGFYGEIPHVELRETGKKPLYHQIFLNKAKNGFIDDGLLPEKIDGSQLLVNFKKSIAVGLQVSEKDLDKLIAVLPDGDLTFENLSRFLAMTRLIRKLRLKTDDFIILTELSTLDVSESPEKTLEFVERAKAALKFPLKPANLKFTLRHESEIPPVVDLEMKDEKITEILVKLQSAYQTAETATRSAFDANLTADEQMEPLRNALAKLTALTEDDVKTIADYVNTVTGPATATAANLFIDSKLPAPFPTADIKAKIIALGATPPAIDEATAAALEAARKAVVEVLLDSIAAFLFDTESRAVLIQTVAAVFKATAELTEAVLDNARLRQPLPGTARIFDLLIDRAILTTSPVSAAALPPQSDALRLLHKLFPLLASFGLSPEAAAWHLKNNQALGWFELDGIPYKAAQTALAFSSYADFNDFLKFAKDYGSVADPADAENPVDFYTLADLLLAGATRTEWIDAYALLTAYEKTNVDAVDAHLFPVFNLADYRSVESWKAVEKCLEHLRKLGTGVFEAKEFAKAVLTDADTASLRSALKARYDEDLWLSTLKEIMDAIRPQKRDALVAYILAENPEMKDENDLFDYFLVDVEMEACMPSSRIVQAHGTIQLFVQRCLMGLEPQAAADLTGDASWEQWKWMKNYRVWEANRKVFLYPENWIEAELRDDKSYLFTELENELLQNELNDYNSEQALIRYLEKLDDIAFLEVVATWYQEDIRVMHVFARTKGGDPALYFYRRFEQERYWTPWEKVELDISGDHLLAFLRNDRLCLAWMICTEEPKPETKATVPALTGSAQEVDAPKPLRKLKIQLAISELANGRWQPKRVSKTSIKTPGDYTAADFHIENYSLLYERFNDQVWIVNNSSKEVDQLRLSGIFEIAGCKGYPELIFEGDNYLPDIYPDFRDSALTIQRYFELNYDLPQDDLALRSGATIFYFYQLLAKTPGNFRITYPHQFTIIDFLMLLVQIFIMHLTVGARRDSRFKLPTGTFLPYFMEDSKHSYVIIPGAYQTVTDPVTGEETLTKHTASDFFKVLDEGDFLEIILELLFWYFNYGDQFKNMYHPLVCPLRTTLYRDGIPKLMERATQMQQSSFNFASYYAPTSVVPNPRPVENVDFDSDGSYSAYNWELFFHVPFLLATRLTKNQRFEEALTWFHYMFNPTGALDGAVPQKYWVTKPFYLTQADDYLEQRIDILLGRVSDPTSPDIAELEFAIDQWRNDPFKPHAIARFRPVAYQKALLMKYIDNLTEWGDYLFRQDTMESIAQATQMYILADKLLGPKPRIVPPPVKPPYETYNQIERKLDAFGNALIDLENILPDLTALPEGGAELPPGPITLSSPYFCIPPNEKMREYWDRVADRLFKIRHCQNIDGVERSLALFAPPIDPGALVRAAAAGLDLSSVIAGLNAPAPYYRFNVLSQKATELVQEIRGLGSSLLAALEKKDAEALSLLRNDLELKVLSAVRDLKVLQIKEAAEQITVLNKTKAVTEEREKYYANIEKIIPNEQLNLDKLGEAQDRQFESQIVRTVAGALALIPEFHLGANGFGGSPEVVLQLGGSAISKATAVGADVLNILSGIASFDASRAATLGGYDRRFDDWKLQEKLAKKELASIEKQIAAAEIRKEISETDLKNHDLQIENAKKNDEFMKSKFTNKQLYEWTIGQIAAVYFRAYQLAFETAKKAERSYKFELGNDDSFIGFGYWDSMKKGLQSADLLYHDIKRMETSYYDKNKREYELTKHVSLTMLDPLALAQLRSTGACNFEIPEAVYDMDHAGHYFRRLKSVSLSLPCVAGPYTSVSAKLSLVSNKYRKNTNADNTAGTGYEEDPGNDERFVYNVGTIQSIAASNAQNDSGMFEMNFRDERYLPFEGCGALSTWRLELPPDVRQFDYATIADAVVHLKYTAREGGSSLRGAASATLKERLLEIQQRLSQTGMHIAFNVKHEMPNEWHLLKKNGAAALSIPKSRLPYFVQSLDTTIEDVIFLAGFKEEPAGFAVTIDENAPTNFVFSDEFKLWRGDNGDIEIDTEFTIAIDEPELGELEELMIIAHYAFPPE
jgi:hypothetical protein